MLSMNKNLLLIFTRNPELGKVKTRLAKTVGDETALEIYKFLLQKTREISLKVRFNKKAIDPLVNLMRTGYSIRTNVKRSKWGMDKLLAFVSDDISIVIEAEALKVN